MNLSKKCFVMLSMLLFALLLQVTSADAAFTRIVAFGDSLTDKGSLPDEFKPPPPYYGGRFSNGIVWVENLVEDAKVAFGIGEVVLEDYALGRSWAEGYPESHQLAPKGFEWIVSDYLEKVIKNPNTLGDERLYVIWIGANDYLGEVASLIGGAFTKESLTTHVTYIIHEQVERLIGFTNAKQFLIINMPDLGTTPGAGMQSEFVGLVLTSLSEIHNAKLHNIVLSLQAKHPDVKFTEFSVFNALREVVNTGKYRGVTFDNVTDPCLNTVASTLCSNPDAYAFFDPIHPTAKMHDLLSEAVMEQLAG